LQLISKPHTGQCGKPEMISPDICQYLTDCPVFATSANKKYDKVHNTTKVRTMLRYHHRHHQISGAPITLRQ